MPPEGRLTLKTPADVAFGFTDDRRTGKGNQDRFAVAYSVDSSRAPGKWFFAGICDGVGGGANGDVAASIALSEIVSELCVSNAGSLELRLSTAIRRAHAQVQERLQKRAATTFAGFLMDERGRIVLGSVGDSRIYSLANGKAEKLSQDDTLAEMLRRKMPGATDQKIRETIQSLHPQFQESLGQAIGSDLPLEPQSSILPHGPAGNGLLICTDGVWKTVEPVLNRTVRASNDHKDLARRLLSLSSQLGATDNATAIVVPDISVLLQWIQEKTSLSERGLVHVLIPGETLVGPAGNFSRRAIVVNETRNALTQPDPPDPRDELDMSAPVVKTLRRRTRPNRTKASEPKNTAQLTIVEGDNDEKIDSIGTVSKNK